MTYLPATEQILIGRSDIDIIEALILALAAPDRANEGTHPMVRCASLLSISRWTAAPIPTHIANTTGAPSVLNAERVVGVGQTILVTPSSGYRANGHEQSAITSEPSR